MPVLCLTAVKKSHVFYLFLFLLILKVSVNNYGQALPQFIQPNCRVHSSKDWNGPWERGDSCYMIPTKHDILFNDSLQICKENHGYPLIIDNKDESKYVYSLIKMNCDSCFWWLGLKGINQTANFVDILTEEPLSFTDWDESEPIGEYIGLSTCAHIYINDGVPRWGPIRCGYSDNYTDSVHKVVCEKNSGMCPAGYALQMDNNYKPVCHICVVGEYQHLGAAENTNGLKIEATCKPCPAGMDTTKPGQTRCLCAQGYEFKRGICKKCGPGYYKGTVGNTSCDHCPLNTIDGQGATKCVMPKCEIDNMVRNNTGDPNSECACDKGYEYLGRECSKCVDGKNKSYVGNTMCIQCSGNRYSHDGVTCDEEEISLIVIIVILVGGVIIIVVVIVAAIVVARRNLRKVVQEESQRSMSQLLLSQSSAIERVASAVASLSRSFTTTRDSTSYDSPSYFTEDAEYSSSTTDRYPSRD